MPAPWVYRLPEINATLNGLSAAALLVGYSFIRKGRVAAHRASMLTAFACSTIFLGGYLYFHAVIGVVHFGGQGWIRPVYFTLLTSHTILAVVILPLVLITLYRALTNQFLRHQAIARWTFPLWLYVGVTGVIVYFLLYRVYPPRYPAGLGPAALAPATLRLAASLAAPSAWQLGWLHVWAQIAPVAARCLHLFA